MGETEKLVKAPENGQEIGEQLARLPIEIV